VRAWLDEALRGEFAALRGRGGPGDEHASLAGRLAWERVLGASEWACVGWPRAYGGRGATLNEQVIFHEEYARARAPGRPGMLQQPGAPRSTPAGRRRRRGARTRPKTRAVKMGTRPVKTGTRPVKRGTRPLTRARPTLW
jgi:alkylation response protein AidB-like acyl-CoA dehydrogenase